MGNFKIKFEGKINGRELHPDTIEMSDLIAKLQEVEQFLSGSLTKKERGELVAKIKDGSIVIDADTEGLNDDKGFIGDLVTLSEDFDINNIDPKRAEILEKWQNESYNFGIKTSLFSDNWNLDLQVTEETEYKRTPPVILKNRLHIFGVIHDMGGKNNVNIHIDTKKYGNITVSCTKKQIKGNEQKLYSRVGVLIEAHQNMKTGELTNARLLEFLPEKSTDFENALEEFEAKSKKFWEDVEDPGTWVRNLRDEKHSVDFS